MGGQRLFPSPRRVSNALSRRPSPSVDPADVARGSRRLGGDWWDPVIDMRALHQINPLRIAWLRDLMVRRLKPSPREGDLPLTGTSILDIGCGAGLLAEPLARLGAEVTGLDPAPGNIEVARQHAAETGATLSYRAATVEQMATEGASFDVVLAMMGGRTCATCRPTSGPPAAGAAGRTVRRLDPEPHL